MSHYLLVAGGLCTFAWVSFGSMGGVLCGAGGPFFTNRGRRILPSTYYVPPCKYVYGNNEYVKDCMLDSVRAQVHLPLKSYKHLSIFSIICWKSTTL